MTDDQFNSVDQKSLLLMAARAVVGESQANTIERVFDALDLTRRRAHEGAFDLGAAYGKKMIEEAFEEGYGAGYEAALDVVHGDEQPEVLSWPFPDDAGC